jgi:hypothetical protein
MQNYKIKKEKNTGKINGMNFIIHYVIFIVYINYLKYFITK